MNKRISYVLDPADGCVDIVVPAAMVAEFQVMVSRATSTWQDMSPDMRDFADRVLGRDHVVGSNMKEGFQEHPVYKAAPIATRSCCGTMLREPHLASCSELSKVKLFRCSECRTVPCSCTFTHY